MGTGVGEGHFVLKSEHGSVVYVQFTYTPSRVRLCAGFSDMHNAQDR